VQAFGNPPSSGTVTASLTTVNSAIVAGQNNVTVVSNVLDGITSVTIPTPGAINGLNADIDSTTGGIQTSGTVTIKVKEGFLAAFTKGGTGATQGVGVRIALSAQPPAGVNLTFPGVVHTVDSTLTGTPPNLSDFSTGSKTGAASGADVTITSTTTAANLFVYYYCSTDAGDAALEFLNIPVTVSTATATLPLAAFTITVTAELAPQNSDTTTAVPRFGPISPALSSATLVSATSPTTVLLMPYAQSYAQTGISWDTGIAIANSTEGDAGITPSLSSNTVVQNGTITFYFFPQTTVTGTTVNTPANFNLSTTSLDPTVISGLDTTGKVPSGSTLVCTLGQLLTAAFPTQENPSFKGYIIAVSNFTNAHGIYQLYSSVGTFTQGTLMPVLNIRGTYPEFVNF